MATSYGRVRRRAQPSDISRIGLFNSTLLSQGVVDGGLEVRIQADAFGCGNPPSLFAVEFNGDIPYRQIEVEFAFLGQLACWTINHSEIIDNYPFPGYTPLMNLRAFNSNNYDKVYDGKFTYELPQFAISNEVFYVFRCDAANNNWGIFNASEYKGFKMIRTRNVLDQPAGFVVGRTCTSTGAQGISVLKNIFFIN